MRAIRPLSPLLLAAALLLPASASAYTVKRTSTGAPVRWSVDRIGLHVGRSLADRIEAGQARHAVGLAADGWRGLGGPELVLSPGFAEGSYRPGAPGCEVHALETWPHAPHLLAVTATSYDDASGRIVDADILVNPAHALAVMNEHEPEAGAFDLGAVLTHEAGHLLGLGESDADPLATMWPRIGRGDTHQRTVEMDDEHGIEAAYADATLTAPSGCGGASVALRGAPPIWIWITAALVAGLLGWMTWRRRNEEGARQRGALRRPSPAPAAGLFFAGAAALLWVPSGTLSNGTGEAESPPPAVRMARALSARGRPPAERRAILAEAAQDEAPEVRRAALEAIGGSPVREDTSLADALVDDEDAAVAELARVALDAARRAPPSAVVDHSPRWDALGAIRATGEARVRGVRRGEDGWLRTSIEVDGVVVNVPGGCLQGQCQQLGEIVVPVDGELIVIGEHGGWARWRDGPGREGVARESVAWGGWLGHGPAVRVSLR